jgi:multiple sugar transport system permease protein
MSGADLGVTVESSPGRSVPDTGRGRVSRAWRRRLLVNVAMVLIGVLFLLPLTWLVFSAVNPHAGASLSAPRLSIANFSAAVHAGAGRAILNSLYLAVVATIVATVVSTLAGYVLSRRYIPLKAPILIVVLFLSGIPVALLLIPIFEIYVKLGWINSPFYTALVLGATSVPFAIWLLKNFIDQVPRDFEEAAAIEGSNSFQVLIRVVIPLIMPGIVVSAILTFINAWGAFLIPLVLDANPSDTPGSIGIYNFISANYEVHYGPLAAYAILFSVPVIVLYLISSRWLSGGFSFAGGIRG